MLCRAKRLCISIEMPLCNTGLSTGAARCISALGKSGACVVLKGVRAFSVFEEVFHGGTSSTRHINVISRPFIVDCDTMDISESMLLEGVSRRTFFGSYTCIVFLRCRDVYIRTVSAVFGIGGGNSAGTTNVMRGLPKLFVYDDTSDASTGLVSRICKYSTVILCGRYHRPSDLVLASTSPCELLNRVGMHDAEQVMQSLSTNNEEDLEVYSAMDSMYGKACATNGSCSVATEVHRNVLESMWHYNQKVVDMRREKSRDIAPLRLRLMTSNVDHVACTRRRDALYESALAMSRDVGHLITAENTIDVRHRICLTHHLGDAIFRSPEDVGEGEHDLLNALHDRVFNAVTWTSLILSEK
jgi:hypothetical protein